MKEYIHERADVLMVQLNISHQEACEIAVHEYLSMVKEQYS